MKLHVGCGKIVLPGYKNLDVIQYPHVDYCCDAKCVPCSNETFNEIYSRHFLEHLDWWDAVIVVKEWHRLLVNNGKVICIVPNLEFHAKQLLLGGQSQYIKKTNLEHAIAGFYGWSDSKHPYMAHRYGYTPKTLAELFDANGFRSISECKKEHEITLIANKK